jgi:serine/threonine protein kinase
MPSPTTIDEFLELVRKSGVVEEKRLGAYLDKARTAQALPAEPARLAGVLVRDGVLTQFQAEQFLQGKWRRFTIGKYKVLERLGQGGMGSVYLCEHKLMRRRVAVKVLPTAKADDTSSLERFYREARAVAALDHPNIVRAYDIDQDDKLHFLVMEHVDGSSLQEIVKKVGPMDVLRACHYIRQAALGLQHAHESAGLVHRDIKPGNILVDRNGIVKVLDMGLARFFHDEEDVLTRKYEENVLGTADYLAPEQALDSHSVDIRADIYSLGATFYFCMTGRRPFEEGSVAQKLIWHQTRQPKPLRQLRPEIPEGVAAVVEKMMAKDPGHRYSTPAEVADALAPWTQTPIPPPPDDEMPQLSPAAMGVIAGDPTLSSGPKTPPSGSQLAPSARKVWQVSQSNTPTPIAPPAPTPAAPPPAGPQRDLRKSNPPPPGPKAMQSATPTGAPGTNPAAPSNSPRPLRVSGSPQVRLAPSPAAKPQRASAPVCPPETPDCQPTHDNAIHSSDALAEAEEAPSWESLTAENGPVTSPEETRPRAARKGPVSSTKRLGGLPPATTPNLRVGWVVGIVSSIVLVMVLVIALLSWLFGQKPDKKRADNPEPIILRVNRLGNDGAHPSIAAALKSIPTRSRQPARIVLEEDIAESAVMVTQPNVTIEAATGKKITWRPSISTNPESKLLIINKAPGFHLKNVTLHGENRIETLVNLFHHCPAMILEDLNLQGFQKNAIWVTNCEGGETFDQYILIHRIKFESTKPEQTDIFFSIENHARNNIPVNKFFKIHHCIWGAGVKIKTPDLKTLAIDLEDGVHPVQGN